MEEILIGTTDRTILVWIADPASTTGAGKTGLNAAALTCTYTRVETDNDVVHTDVTSSLNDLTNLTDAHNDWGLKEVSNTLSKGLYRLDLADALFASGAWYTVVQLTITSGTAAATPKAFKLVNLDMFGTPATNIATAGTNYSAERGLSGTALPAAAAAAAGGLIILGSNNTAAITIGALTTGAISGTTLTFSGAVAFQSTFAVTTSTSLGALSATTFATSGTTTFNAFTVTNAFTVSGATTLTGGVAGNITGNLSGSVGSVTGAVGSVTAGVTVTTNNDKTGYSLTTAPLTVAETGDAVLDEVVEGSYSVRHLLRGFASALMAKVSGMEANAPVFRDIDNTKNRISATTTVEGNRTAIILDLT